MSGFYKNKSWLIIYLLIVIVFISCSVYSVNDAVEESKKLTL